jgi:hypothetical protein
MLPFAQINNRFMFMIYFSLAPNRKAALRRGEVSSRFAIVFASCKRKRFHRSFLLCNPINETVKSIEEMLLIFIKKNRKNGSFAERRTKPEKNMLL